MILFICMNRKLVREDLEMEKELKNYKKYFVEFDWKTESKDVLYLIREMYGKLYCDIMEKNFDELAENYAKESTEDFINALGQELSSKNLLLYEITSDGDNYILVVVPIEEENNLNNYLEVNNRKGEIKKQSGRKLGNVAKRIELAKRIPFEKYLMPKDYMPKGTMDDLLILYCIKHSPPYNSILDVSNWPPQKINDLNLFIRPCTDCGSNRKIALVRKDTLDKNGKLIEKEYDIVSGYDINNISEWKCLCSDLQIKVDRMIFFNNMLFLFNRDSVYLVSDLNHFKESMIKILDLKVPVEPFIYDDNLYLYAQINRAIYKLEKKNISTKTEWKMKKFYAIRAFDVRCLTKMKDNKIVFQAFPFFGKR